jgi:outer membrane receptor for ferrienterochelin and colicin
MRTLGLRLILLATALGGAHAAPGTDDEDLALAYGDAATVSIATGSKQSLRRAPAVASVFTAEDIRAMGASDLREVLAQVPGLHVSVSPFIYEPRYMVRGVQSAYSPQVLVLIDGVRRQSPYLGSAEDGLDQHARCADRARRGGAGSRVSAIRRGRIQRGDSHHHLHR